MNYRSWAIFMGCAMLCRGDIAALWAELDGRAPHRSVNRCDRASRWR